MDWGNTAWADRAGLGSIGLITDTICKKTILIECITL